MRRIGIVPIVAAALAVLCLGPPAANAASTADVVFLIDESGSMGGEHAWLTNMVSSLDSEFVNAGITGNQYALVGFGSIDHASSQAPHKHDVDIVTAGQQDWGTASQLSAATVNLVTYGGFEDGWAAIDFAINNYSFRGNAAVNFVLVTDEDRDNSDSSLTYAGVLSDMQGLNALLNAVVDASFRTGETPDKVALGVASPGGGAADANSYKADGSGGFIKVEGGGYASGGYYNTVADYVDLAWDTGGAAWDLNQLRAGGLTADSFTAAFVDVKVEEVGEQPSSYIPEPMTMVGALAGVAGLAGYLRRRRLA